MTNPIVDPFVEVPNTDATSSLVRLEATPAGVVTVTLNRPERRNAFNAELIAAMHEVFQTLEGDEAVRVVFLRGAGGTFSAGADLDWMRAAADRTERDNRDDAYEMARMFKSLSDIPALTVALVEGGAFGGGAGLACACDLAVGVADTKFSFSEVRLGLIAATISPYVVDALGPRNTRALFATGRLFDASYAEKIGLLSEVVADAAGLDLARDRIAEEMMACAPRAVADSKRLVRDVAYRPVEDVMDETAKRIARARVSDEGQDGVRAFLERRKPSWAI